jgi:hypothetical protein
MRLPVLFRRRLQASGQAIEATRERSYAAPMPKQSHWLPPNLASAVFFWSLEPDAGTAEHRAKAWRSTASCFRRRDSHTALRPIRQSMIPHNGSGAMVSDNGFAAMVADNGWLPVIPNHHRHAVIAHDGIAAMVQGRCPAWTR